MSLQSQSTSRAFSFVRSRVPRVSRVSRSTSHAAFSRLSLRSREATAIFRPAAATPFFTFNANQFNASTPATPPTSVPYLTQSSIVLHAPSVRYLPISSAVKMFFCVFVYTGTAPTTLLVPRLVSRPDVPLIRHARRTSDERPRFLRHDDERVLHRLSRRDGRERRAQGLFPSDELGAALEKPSSLALTRLASKSPAFVSDTVTVRFCPSIARSSTTRFLAKSRARATAASAATSSVETSASGAARAIAANAIATSGAHARATRARDGRARETRGKVSRTL